MLDFVGVALLAISTFGFVPRKDGGHWGDASWITAGPLSGFMEEKLGWDLDKLSDRATVFGWLLLLAGLALQIADSRWGGLSSRSSRGLKNLFNGHDWSARLQLHQIPLRELAHGALLLW